MKRYIATVGADSRNGGIKFTTTTGMSRSTQAVQQSHPPLLNVLREDDVVIASCFRVRHRTGPTHEPLSGVRATQGTQRR